MLVEGVEHIRDGAKPDGASIVQAVDDSLTRLQTDYIDLFQIHWPNRAVPHFAKHWPGEINVARIDASYQSEDILGLLRGLDKCVKAGKVRFCGLSNETPWGVNEYLRLAKLHNLPIMISVQNEFNLLHTMDWPYMMEMCSFEQCRLSAVVSAGRWSVVGEVRCRRSTCGGLDGQQVNDLVCFEIRHAVMQRSLHIWRLLSSMI